MPPQPIGETAMTGAERQARYRAAHGNGAPVIRIRRPTDRRSRIQRWNDTIAAAVELQAEYATWLTRCRIINRTARSRRPCGRLSNSISPSLRRLNRRAASAVTEHPDDPDGRGHDDARGDLSASAGDRRDRGSMPG